MINFFRIGNTQTFRLSYIALPQNESVNCAYFSIWPGPPGSTVIAESLFLPDFYHGVKIKKLPALLW